jgi:hypothetical protein
MGRSILWQPVQSAGASFLSRWLAFSEAWASWQAPQPPFWMGACRCFTLAARSTSALWQEVQSARAGFTSTAALAEACGSWQPRHFFSTTG